MKITVVYQGGSGGFLLYYYLLLSGRFQHSIGATWRMIERQFPSSLTHNRHAWKHNESWPDNQSLMTSPDPAVMLICNPLFCHDLYHQNRDIIDGSHAILLRTEFRAQLRMAYEKQAYWFTATSRAQFDAPAGQRQYLRRIISEQINGYDPVLIEIMKQFDIDQIVDLQHLLHGEDLDHMPQANNDQIAWVRRWWNMQSPKTQKLLS